MLETVVRTDFEIRHLFVSSGHNYVGHHEKPPSEHVTVEVDQVQCVTGKGIVGDRYFGFKNGYKGQITFFEEETYQDLCSQFGVWDRGPEVFRRNVITRGIHLNELIGVEFELQGIRFFRTRGMSALLLDEPGIRIRNRKRHEGPGRFKGRNSK